jgi:hypothetical protein
VWARAGRAVLLHDIDTLQASPAEGLALLESQPVDLVIQDMNFSEDTTSGEGEACSHRSARATLTCR